MLGRPKNLFGHPKDLFEGQQRILDVHFIVSNSLLPFRPSGLFIAAFVALSVFVDGVLKM